MASMYVTEHIQEKIDDCQELLKEEIGFKPDKVDVMENALDTYISELEKDE